MKLLIVDRKQIADKTLEVSFGLAGGMKFAAGQYVHIQILGLDSKDWGRQFSICNSPNDKQDLSIAFRLNNSPFKQFLATSPIGSEVEITGPFGNLILEKDSSLPVIFIAGGIGITPFLSMLRFAAEEKLPHKITLLYFNKNKKDAAYLEDLEKLKKQNSNFKLVTIFGSVTGESIKKTFEELPEAKWYISGLPIMTDIARKILSDLRVADESVYFEESDNAMVAGGKSFFSIIDSSSDGVAITDLRGILKYVNPAWQKLTGWKLEEVVGKTTPRAIKSGQYEQKLYSTELWDAVLNGRTFRGEIVNKRKNGTFYSTDEIIFPLRSPSGSIIGFTAFQRDITERKRAEEALKKHSRELADAETAMLNILEDAKELEDELKVEKAGVEKKVQERTRQLAEEQARLQASINSLPVGFVMTDTKENIVTMNGIAKSLLCLKAEDHSAGTITKENIADLDCDLHEIGERLKGSLDIKPEIDKVIKNQRPFEVKDLALDDLFLHIFIAPIVTEEDKKFLVIGAVILVENVTEQKILDRSKDEFFSIASHELRTPLTAIKGNASMMLDYFGEQLKDPQLNEMVNDIHESSIRLISIVNDFLDTSRLELNKMEFKKDVFDLSKLIPDIIKQYQVTGSRKKLDINFDDAVKAPSVVGDQDRYRQILINLVGNALKFTEKGGITINLKQDGDFVKTMVTDTGIGISGDNQKLLFRKFQQAESNILTRDVIKGTGLGLYISKMMCEGMGGRICLENSVAGKGSTFSFSLPVATPADETAAKAAAAKASSDIHAGPAMNTDKSGASVTTPTSPVLTQPK